jgi:hypothetical protein
MTLYHAYEKALSIIREVGKRKEYFHPCREDKVVLLMLVNMPERVDFANQQIF